MAGATLGAVMVPVGLAFGDLARVGPVAGLYSAILPLIAYVLFGSSRQLVVGPDASTAALVGATVAPLAAGDPLRATALAMAFAVLVGLFCVAGGIARIGFRWTEEWQTGERAAESDRRGWRVLGTFESVAAMKEALKQRARASA